jgi:hypothetical protein
MPWVEFESTVPAFEQAKTVYALDRAAIVIEIIYLYEIIKYMRFAKHSVLTDLMLSLFSNDTRVWI